MTRNESGRGSMSNEYDEENKRNGKHRWGPFRQLVLPRPKGKKSGPHERQSDEHKMNPIRRSSRFADLSFPHKQKLGMEGTKNGTGSASKSSRSFKKTKTFLGMFGRGQAKSSEDQIGGGLEAEFGTIHQPSHANSSTTGTSQTPSEEENPNSTPKSDRFRFLKALNSNRMMLFKGDLPPSSPMSIKRHTSGETENHKVSRKDLDGEAKSRRMKLLLSNGGSCKGGSSGEKGEADSKITPDIRSIRTSTRKSKTIVRKSLRNMRIGSTAMDDGFVASRLRSSPLGSPRRLQKKTSSLPKHLGLAVRSTSAPEERRDGDGAKKEASNDFESPWGVKHMGEANGEGDYRSSSKTFRVSDFVNGLKARKQAQFSSNSLSLTDEETQDARDTAQPVDMLEDEFVNYAVKHILKRNRRKSSRGKMKKV